MSGLDLKKDVILEVGAIITDKDLNLLDQGIEFVVQTDKLILDGMDEW
jgi:oligoribonuclease